ISLMKGIELAVTSWPRFPKRIGNSWELCTLTEMDDNSRMPERSFIEIECPTCHSKRPVYNDELQPIKCYSCGTEMNLQPAQTAKGTPESVPKLKPPRRRYPGLRRASVA